jgi:hypothetical protein
VLIATTWADIGWAFVTGIVATAAWTALLIAVQRWRHGKALDAFVGSYDSYSKLEGESLGRVDIRREDDVLKVGFKAPERGEIAGRITLSERFPKSGRAAYEQRLPDGRLAWGTWDVHLADSGDRVLVTTRYVDDVDPVEVVQGSEWRRRGRA